MTGLGLSPVLKGLLLLLLLLLSRFSRVLTLCDPIDGSPPGSPVPGILQARSCRIKLAGRISVPASYGRCT